MNPPASHPTAPLTRCADAPRWHTAAHAAFSDTLPAARDRWPAAGPEGALRVAIVTETYPPEVNGVATTVARVVEGLQRRGHRLQLVRLRQPGLRSSRDEVARAASPQAVALDECLLPGLGVPRYPGLRMGLPATGTLTRLWRRHRPDLVHLVTEGPLGWSALRAARRLALPVVSDFRTNFQAYSRHYGAAWLHDPIAAYLRRFHNRTACTMVPTLQLRDALAAQGFERLRVVARGVDARRFHPARRDAALRAAWGAGPDTPVALCVGRLAPEKGLDTVIDAFRALRAARPDARLVLVGDGPERARLMARCPEAVFAGVQRGDALAAHYASADLFLFASTTETYGNVVPEAMASALAVVAYDHAAAGALIDHGRDGLLAPPSEREAFLQHAAQLAAAPGLARRLGAQARLTALELDWQRIVEAIEREYRAAVECGGDAPESEAMRPGWPGWLRLR